MNACRSFVIAVAVSIPATLHAQRTDSTAVPLRADTSGSLSCPGTGMTARAWTGAGLDSGGRRSAVPAAPRSSSAGALDTVITLNITDRSWQRDSLSAGVSLGVAGTAGARRAPWHACAGASVMLGRVTATLHNVHGQIRLRADPAALKAVGGGSGSTPPAPPRR